MGSLLNIQGLTDKQEAALIKAYKYAVKVQGMVENYRNARDRAIANYQTYARKRVTIGNYESAWAIMPANYAAAMSNVNERLRNWLVDYFDAIFDMKITPDQAGQILAAIQNYLRQHGARIP